MPDFDTRRPQEPDQPSNIHMTRLLGIRVSILLPTVLAMVLGVVILVWFVLSPAERLAGTSKGQTWIEYTAPTADKRKAQTITQLNQKLRLKPPPKYTIEVDSANYAADSTAVTCSQEDVDRCMHVTTAEPYPSAKDLASITRSILEDEGLSPGGNGDEPKAISIQLAQTTYPDYPNRSYCFASKDDLVATLGKESLEHEASLLGRIEYSSQEHCYIAVY